MNLIHLNLFSSKWMINNVCGGPRLRRSLPEAIKQWTAWMCGLLQQKLKWRGLAPNRNVKTKPKYKQTWRHATMAGQENFALSRLSAPCLYSSITQTPTYSSTHTQLPSPTTITWPLRNGIGYVSSNCSCCKACTRRIHTSSTNLSRHACFPRRGFK